MLENILDDENRDDVLNSDVDTWIQHLSLNPEAICWEDICKLDVESHPANKDEEIVEIFRKEKKSRKKALGKGKRRRRQEEEEEEEEAEQEEEEEEETEQEQEEEERQEEVDSEAEANNEEVPESSALEDIKKEVLKLKTAVKKRDKKIMKALSVSRSTINQGLEDLLMKVATLMKNANGAAAEREEVGETSAENTEEYYNYDYEEMFMEIMK